ncbi:enoyl-CoA hydratase-related protein [Arcobacter sp. LA11]|uniref:enoyl-CoA hydratase-related protein n=1 Tax=Arcobacter sp. LA11 TaxID=1898176 RepID=UPI000932964F|nr:enoyl-CoA hydratase-related protein [Arcobacter sp. LA11]
MKILLLISSFNSLSQRVYCELKELNHEVSICLGNEKNLIEDINDINPDIIFCPFLKEYLTHDIYETYPTFILHPGIIGDRGHQSLDHAINEEKEQWGVVILKANEELDGGDIYASSQFKMRITSKGSIYRNEVCDATSNALKDLLNNLQDSNFKPIPQIQNDIHETLTQKKRKIDWGKDTTDVIIKKINMSDSYPGVKENLLGIDCFLYGVCKEDTFKGKSKEILAKRDGAICIATSDGAIWVSHLKKEGSFKLPATYVLKDKIKGIKEHRIPLFLEDSKNTFHEIYVEKKDDIAYLHFDFHNGAMNSEQAIRLKYAVEYLKEECKVLVLMGGEEFFSNGIHLNILEDSKKQGEDGWSNINAMNDVVKSILFAEDIITVASFSKNAGAGGVFLGLVCDYCIARDGIVLNPHYQTMGLSGSEYHTFSFYKRVEKNIADEILFKCIPVGNAKAKKIGMIDEVYPSINYQENLEIFCKNLISDENKYEDFIDEKKDFIFDNEEKIEKLKEKELQRMYPEFWDKNSSFHYLRNEFIYKKEHKDSLKRLKEL